MDIKILSLYFIDEIVSYTHKNVCYLKKNEKKNYLKITTD